jgi:hypothetical protein
MISIIDIGPGVLGYRINGSIEKADIERVVRDLQLGIPRTNYLTRLEKVALVSDSDIVRMIAGVQSHIARALQVKVFDASASADATTWILAP